MSARSNITGSDCGLCLLLALVCPSAYAEMSCRETLLKVCNNETTALTDAPHPCGEAAIPLRERTGEKCAVFVEELFQLLQPHARQNFSRPWSGNYSENCSYNHAAPEITDLYLLRLLQDGALEKSFAYLLINLRIAVLRTPTVATNYGLFDLALDAVRSADDTPPDLVDANKPQRQVQQALRLIALLNHNHSLEMQLMDFTEAEQTLLAQSEGAIAPQKHYYGRYWRSELASAILRGYRLREKFVDTTPDALRPAAYWSGALVACELRAKGHSRETAELGGQVLQLLHRGTLEPVESIEFAEGAAWGAERCAL